MLKSIIYQEIQKILEEDFLVEGDFRDIPKHPDDRTASIDASEAGLMPSGGGFFKDKSGKTVAKIEHGHMVKTEPGEEQSSADYHPTHLAKNQTFNAGDVGDPHAPHAKPLRSPYGPNKFTDKTAVNDPKKILQKVPGSIEPPLDENDDPIEVEHMGRRGYLDYHDQDTGMSHISFHDGGMEECPSQEVEEVKKPQMNEGADLHPGYSTLWQELGDDIFSQERHHWDTPQWEDSLKQAADELRKRCGGDREAHDYLLNRAKELKNTFGPNLPKREWMMRNAELLYMGRLAKLVNPDHLNDREPIENREVAEQPMDQVSGVENWQRMADQAAKKYKAAKAIGDMTGMAIAHEELQGIRNAMEN